eukprot:scaffold324_cov326-Pavlova_lutheri.AAC.40
MAKKWKECAPSWEPKRVRDASADMQASPAEDRARGSIAAADSSACDGCPARVRALACPRAITRRGGSTAVISAKGSRGILDGRRRMGPRSFLPVLPGSKSAGNRSPPSPSDDPIDISNPKRSRLNSTSREDLRDGGKPTVERKVPQLRASRWRSGRRLPRRTSDGSCWFEMGTGKEKRCWCPCDAEEERREDGCKPKDKPNRNRSSSTRRRSIGCIRKERAKEVREMR